MRTESGKNDNTVSLAAAQFVARCVRSRERTKTPKLPARILQLITFHIARKIKPKSIAPINRIINAEVRSPRGLYRQQTE
ncbi:hypothetical protein RUM43_003011 [Polyplax serrata]|uniref:Uncharacterized protein n=1 Tax=Polyplax serrata TaxID=468196 RepID=A0AAN8NZI0_POLSC